MSKWWTVHWVPENWGLSGASRPRSTSFLELAGCPLFQSTEHFEEKAERPLWRLAQKILTHLWRSPSSLCPFRKLHYIMFIWLELRADAVWWEYWELLNSSDYRMPSEASSVTDDLGSQCSQTWSSFYSWLKHCQPQIVIESSSISHKHHNGLLLLQTRTVYFLQDREQKWSDGLKEQEKLVQRACSWLTAALPSLCWYVQLWIFV